ncbi:MAG: TetR/AcrR family transcriptional regulator [Halioglobus sp.]|nr:TetR/AcrR family transcriptional regulator [Halioglobus sp.]
MPEDTRSDRGAPSSPFNRTAQHDAKRAAILSQAARLFNSKGSRATTLKDIAESLGLTKTSLYYYVKTKEELIYQCYMATLDHHHQRLDEIEHSHAQPVARATAFFRQHFDDWRAAREGHAPHNAVLLEIAALKGPHREEVEARYVELFKRLRDNLREGIEQGSLRPCDPTSTTLAILGSLDWTFSWLNTIPAERLEQAVDAAQDLVANGLYAGPGYYEPGDLDVVAQASAPLPGFNRDEQNRLKQEAFFRTGTWFFNKKGFNGTSLDEIAEHLNVSKGAFYYHIRNKEDLLVSCYDRSLDYMERLYEKAAAADGDGLHKAEIVCRNAFFIQNSEEGPLIRYNSITALPMERRLKILERTDRANQRFGDFLQQGIEDGSVRPVDTYVAQHLIAGAINAAMDINLWRRVDSIDAAAIDYFDVFFNGLLPRRQG